MIARHYPRRLDVLGSPWEWSVLGVGDERRQDRYRSLATVARVNLPRRLRGEARARAAVRVRDELIDRTTFHAS